MRVNYFQVRQRVKRPVAVKVADCISAPSRLFSPTNSHLPVTSGAWPSGGRPIRL